jgi:pyruvate dehydrogenase E2 component (dihydrolipoyllysine-residue acetyltransferase)
VNDFVMPKLGADMTAGTLVAWHKKPGEEVHRGDIMAEVDTDKGVIDIEAFSDGILETLLVQPGASVPVGTPLARIRTSCEPSHSDVTPRSPTASNVAKLEPAPPVSADAAASAPAEEAGRLRISPSARQRARELGVDPGLVRGTGRGGAITREDIEHAAASRPPATQSAASSPERAPPIKPAETTDRSLRMRQAIAAAMTRANREIPHYYLSTTIDMKAISDWLAKENERRTVTERLLYGVLLLKATALALQEVPELNGFWQDDRLVVQESIHLGVAVSLRGGGLIAPALHDVDHKSLTELMRELRDLVARVRAGGLRSSELADPTITVTSLGEQGVEAVFGVIYPPQVALVGFGKVVERPWCVEGQIVARPVITATLAGDHRATDGHRGSIFLAALAQLLQEPEKL